MMRSKYEIYNALSTTEPVKYPQNRAALGGVYRVFRR